MAWDPPRHTVHVGDDGQVEFHLSIDIAPAGNGSRLRQELVMKPRWWLTLPMAALWPLMMRKRAQAAMDKTVANIKRFAEAEAGGGWPSCPPEPPHALHDPRGSSSRSTSGNVCARSSCGHNYHRHDA